MDLVKHALGSAQSFPRKGRWTPLAYSDSERGAAAYVLADAIRTTAYMFTAEERAQFAIELLSHHSCDHAHDRDH